MKNTVSYETRIDWQKQTNFISIKIEQVNNWTALHRHLVHMDMAKKILEGLNEQRMQHMVWFLFLSTACPWPSEVHAFWIRSAKNHPNRLAKQQHIRLDRHRMQAKWCRKIRHEILSMDPPLYEKCVNTFSHTQEVFSIDKRSAQNTEQSWATFHVDAWLEKDGRNYLLPLVFSSCSGMQLNESNRWVLAREIKYRSGTHGRHLVKDEWIILKVF